MTHEMKNIGHLNQLRANLINKEDHGSEGVRFEGLVVYEASDKKYSEVLDIYLITHGYNPAIKFDIFSKAKIITIDNVHMDFNPRSPHNTFRYRKGEFIISGVSSKIGSYKISIVELL